ncbi:peroxidase family protein [Synechococcus sp. PCC 7336]|uniref:peroxidase family protein n=1 Tax=Synechococcus sp. PCC 7336 TaxID=195250 RepID=UPI00034C1BE2|nr:peroxidase family protein [Synechococcus sp. PCC 7336]
MAKRPWHQQPLLFALLKLREFRNNLRRDNLHDTSQFPDRDKLPKPAATNGKGHLKARTPDGSYNDPDSPEMGMAGTRFGRNVPLADAFPDKDKLLTPNPRVLSRKLMTREEFVPATIVNLLAAPWIQFQNHDWMSHGDNQPNNKVEIPLEEDDPWPQEHRPLAIKKTLEDESRDPNDTSNPPSFINEVTHWWDGSQIYGSDRETVEKLRSHVDGKLTIEDNGLLPLDPELGIDSTGFNDNYWIGLSLLHTLFVKEHNTICDRLKQKYSNMSDDELFDKARLINAALMAKIHTVEWTPAILPHPATVAALNANWYGLLGQKFKNFIGRIGDSEALSGIIGSSTDQFGAPYYLTEEFVSVYRLHPLIPDDYDFRSLDGDRTVLQKNFFEISGNRARAVVEQVGMDDLFYSFGTAYPGAITLHNYPKFLQQFAKDNGEVFDLAAVDILRDRERGVPRYNRFRELLGRGKVKSFDEITSNPTWASELKELYNNDIDSIDLMVGMFAEDLPDGFGFSDTAFRIFILMASRRLKSDRFFTKDYTAEVYTQLGLEWIDKTSMLDVLERHYPALAPCLEGVENAFAPWKRAA